MVVYPNPAPRTLSDSHGRMLFEESGISPDVAAARGYRTIRHRSEVPAEFANWQRRLGLLVPTHSPSGTSGHQLRPERPIKRKKGNAPKYETAEGAEIRLDVNPLMLEEVRAGAGDLWLTEGCKKVDALTSQGLPTVGIIGVWNFAEPGSKSRVPLPCWAHVRTKGRRVYVVYDADASTNPDVQEALRRLVAMLEGLGAKVLVVYLPEVNGDGKAGVDDYLAGGGTVAELRMMAGPYRPVDVGAERMSRDEKLRAAVEDLERRWWDEEWKGRGGHTERDVAHQLIEAATRCGKLHADGLRVKVSWGVLQVGAKVARKTLAKALARLEERGFLYRDNEGRKAATTGAFVLVAKVDQNGRGVTHATPELRVCDPGGLPSQVPRLRWSRPKWTPRRGTVRGTRKPREGKTSPAQERVERLGKIRGAAVDALVVAGGTLTLPQLCEVLHRSRAYDLTRRKRSPKGHDGPLIMLEDAGIIELDGDIITLAADWSERLDTSREAGGELEADELAERDRRRKSRGYHRRRKVVVSEHWTNHRNTDGAIEDLQIDEPQMPTERQASPLAEAVRGYLDRNPHDASQPPGWIGSTLWALDEYSRVTPAEVRAAIDELGGERFLRDRLAGIEGAA